MHFLRTLFCVLFALGFACGLPAELRDSIEQFARANDGYNGGGSYDNGGGYGGGDGSGYGGGDGTGYGGGDGTGYGGGYGGGGDGYGGGGVTQIYTTTVTATVGTLTETLTLLATTTFGSVTETSTATDTITTTVGVLTTTTTEYSDTLTTTVGLLTTTATATRTTTKTDAFATTTVLVPSPGVDTVVQVNLDGKGRRLAIAFGIIGALCAIPLLWLIFWGCKRRPVPVYPVVPGPIPVETYPTNVAPVTYPAQTGPAPPQDGYLASAQNYETSGAVSRGPAPPREMSMLEGSGGSSGVIPEDVSFRAIP